MTTNAIIAASGALLLRQRLHSLFIHTAKLHYDYPVRFASYEQYCRQTLMTRSQLEAEANSKDGCTVPRKGWHVVLFNEQIASFRRRNFTLAHEIGHIHLGHKDDSPQSEGEANLFAACLLMHPALAGELARRWGQEPTADQLCEIFAVSRQAAAISWRRALSYRLQPGDQELLRRYGPMIPDTTGPIVN